LLVCFVAAAALSIIMNFNFRLFGQLETETKMPEMPKKLSSASFKNAIIDYWKYRIENIEKVSELKRGRDCKISCLHERQEMAA